MNAGRSLQYALVYMAALLLVLYIFISLPLSNESYAIGSALVFPIIFVVIFAWLNASAKAYLIRCTAFSLMAAVTSVLIMATDYGSYMPQNYIIAKWLGVDGEAAGDARIAEQLFKWWAAIVLILLLCHKVISLKGSKKRS